MNGLEKVVEYIRADTSATCLEIAQQAANECTLISDDYTKREQGKYWEAINKGTKSAQQRLDTLNNLAATEASKQIAAMQREMVEAAFGLAAKKLHQLPDDEFQSILIKHGLPPDSDAEYLVSLFKERLSRSVSAVLFD
ncbi:MAG: V-type ATP synthase subunit E family protein [Oscillospiraceae bacterium]|nr:V-type ATP synthase subunit E family protein [Oscillospiraceae bacterium]